MSNCRESLRCKVDGWKLAELTQAQALFVDLAPEKRVAAAAALAVMVEQRFREVKIDHVIVKDSPGAVEPYVRVLFLSIELSLMQHMLNNQDISEFIELVRGNNGEPRTDSANTQDTNEHQDTPGG